MNKLQSYIKKRKEIKAKKIKEQERAVQEQKDYQELTESIKKSFEEFKIRTMATKGKNGSVEVKTSVSKDENGETKKEATIAYTDYGPIVITNVNRKFVKDGYNYVDNYVTYEGIIPHESGLNPGFYSFKSISHATPNPIERETYYSKDYKGGVLGFDGNITKITEHVDTYGHSGKFGQIAKYMESTAKEMQKTQAENEAAQQKM